MMKRREEIVEMWPKNCTWSGLKILTFEFNYQKFLAQGKGTPKVITYIDWKQKRKV